MFRDGTLRASLTGCPSFLSRHLCTAIILAYASAIRSADIINDAPPLGNGATPMIQVLAGHGSPSTTMRYDRSGEEDRREALEILHVSYERRYPAR